MADDSVLIVDIGSASVKAGFAGDDAPCAVFPSIAQKSARGAVVRTLLYVTN